MKKKIGLLICLMFLFTISAYAKEPENVNTISVQGSSHLEVMPDQASLTIGVNTTDTTAEAARNSNATKASSLQNKLLSFGIDSDDIKTSNYSIYPIYGDTDNNKPAPIIGYKVNHSIKVTINDLNALGTIIDSCIQDGATEIENIKFTRKDELGFKKLALAAAVNEASAKADAIAQALGKKVTNVVAVTENGVNVNSSDMTLSRYYKENSAAATPIQPGSIKLQANVNITFAMQ